LSWMRRVLWFRSQRTLLMMALYSRGVEVIYGFKLGH
jgi:hypothetical protein